MDEQASLAGDNAAAWRTVAGLAEEIGFVPVDCRQDHRGHEQWRTDAVNGIGAKPSSNGSQGWSVPEPKCDLPQFGAGGLNLTRIPVRQQRF
jgi:hypothetical protein